MKDRFQSETDFRYAAFADGHECTLSGSSDESIAFNLAFGIKKWTMPLLGDRSELTRFIIEFRKTIHTLNRM
jgi:hypothetical protein